MKTGKQDWRLERKFLIQKPMASQWEAAIRNHPLGYRRAFPDRSVHSVYIESLDYQDSLAHQDGSLSRYKMRVRWYGKPVGKIKKPYLEIKQKHGNLGRKLRYRLRDFTLNSSFTRASLTALFKEADLPQEILEASYPRTICFYNRYRRRYFVDLIDRYRLTLDTDLRFRMGGPFGSAPTAMPPGPDLSIVELKYNAEYEAGAFAAVQGIPLRMVRNSKFLQGVETWLEN